MAEPKHQEPSSSELAAVVEQYEAGYAARFRDEAMSVGATASWQAGWSDANRELGRFDEAFTAAQSALPFFGTGEVCPSPQTALKSGSADGLPPTPPWA